MSAQKSLLRAALPLLAGLFWIPQGAFAAAQDYDHVQFAVMPHSELDFVSEDGTGLSIGASWLFQNLVNLYVRHDHVDYDRAYSDHHILGLGWRFALTGRIDGIAGLETGRIRLKRSGDRDTFTAKRIFAGVGGRLWERSTWSARYYRDADYLGRFEGYYYALEFGYRFARGWSAVFELESGHYENLESQGGDPERDDLLLGLRYLF